MPNSPTAEESAAVARHFAYLMSAKQAGTVFMAGRTMVAPFVGIVVFEADKDEEAQGFMMGDPAIEAGVFEGVVQPFAWRSTNRLLCRLSVRAI